MRLYLFLFFFSISFVCKAQYSFSGYISPEESDMPIYLSIIEDYRKLSGIHTEQIIAKTNANTSGFFEFTGNMLDIENRIYRIHVDKCLDVLKDTNHFNGHCSDSKSILFIAKNTDSLKLPFSFGKQIFCSVESSNPKANAFIKIDSLKNDMRFAYGEFRSEANRKLNNRKWFKTLQYFGEALNEPLAELYIYGYLSKRSSDLHSYYAEDLKNNPYYDNLKTRLIKAYPNANYTKQYINELRADRYMLSASKINSGPNWTIYIGAIAVMSFVLNLGFYYLYWKQKKNTTKHLKAKLSKREQVVLEHLLNDKTNKAIAETLFLSVSTVKTHINNIYKKLHIQSREEAKTLFCK